MSRHTFKTTFDSRPVEVAAGWDRPLQGFYMTVLYTDDTADYEYAFSNLEMTQSHPLNFDEFRDVLHNLGITLPQAMVDDIIKDGSLNMGNKIRDWTATPSHMPPDPDGKNDERAEAAHRAILAFEAAMQTDREDALGDLLCDLRHWADLYGQDFDAILTRSNMHYEAETRAEPTEDEDCDTCGAKPGETHRPACADSIGRAS